ncbi:hypothetical protein NCCP28_00930 [Niallia sp. NCCP-28]|nr:hypothetical protein NCCP28_00930 [Niallia sp. NCCP-28]
MINDEWDEELFPTDEKVIEGTALEKSAENNIYYIIFADLQAYPKERLRTCFISSG